MRFHARRTPRVPAHAEAPSVPSFIPSASRLRLLRQVHQQPTYPQIAGNRVRLLVDGDQAFPTMLAAMETARKSLCLESYIYAADATGRRFLDAMVCCAQRGVGVYVMVDGVGSMGTDARFFQPLLKAGGQLTVFHPPRLWPPMWGWWQRDHRKLLIVDNQMAFIGGLNIADDYAPPSWGGGGWHDMQAQVEGPAAAALGKVFARTWQRQAKKPCRIFEGGKPKPAGSVAIQILESRLTQRPSVRRAYLWAICQARVSIKICNAYCIPDWGMLRALRQARRRGVCVQLLLAGTTDSRMVQFAARALYQTMLHWGFEIYEWTDRVLHAKSAVIDGLWCSLGSYNMDRRSLLYNLEANVAFADPHVGAVLEEQFQQDINKSHRIDRRVWHRRSSVQKILEQVFYKLRDLL